MSARQSKLYHLICWRVLFFALPGFLIGQTDRLNLKSPPYAEIKTHNGTPTLFLDGKPTFYGVWWCSAPEEDGWRNEGFAKENAQAAGIHFYAFDVGRDEWCGPRKCLSGHFDFSTVETRFNRILLEDPNARFHLRIYLERADRWWLDLYPDEVEVVSDNSKDRQSFASAVWREQAKEFLKAYIAHLQKIGLDDRIVAYQVGAGHTGEWVKGKVSMSFFTGDYSAPMRRHFRDWLRRQYNKDESALKKAWNKSDVSFDTAEVPSDIEQFGTKHWTFRDSAQEQNVIDYYRCLADLCGDLVVDFCKTVKEATAGRSLAGAFYGYLMELTWNAGFFGEGGKGSDSEYSTYQRSGHLGFAKALNSPFVDFFVSPYSYGFRGKGGEGCGMLLTESLRLHNKMYIYEDDSRTHTLASQPEYGRAMNLSESTAFLRRNLAYNLTRGQGIWWLINQGHIDPMSEPAFRPILKDFQELGSFSLNTDRTPCAEVAVFIDDESFFYETVKNDLDMPLIFKQRHIGLARFGAPYDLYLLSDFLEARLPPYKLYIFLNPIRLDETRRAALKRESRKSGRTAVWVYAPGYIEDAPSIENMADLTAFRFGMNDHPWASFLHITNFSHPITEDLSQDLFWGADSRLVPMFYIDDPEAVILGEAVFAQGTCKPGFGLKKFRDWNSIYISVPDIPASVLRGIARFAGVHLYNDQGDVLSVSSELLSVHTVCGGKRTFRLPIRVEVVYDLFEKKIIAENTDCFEVMLPPVSTAFYYTGKAQRLSELGK